MVENIRWRLRVVETSVEARTIESVLESHGPCKSFELSIVRIGLETTELRGENEVQIATVVGGRPFATLASPEPCALEAQRELDVDPLTDAASLAIQRGVCNFSV